MPPMGAMPRNRGHGFTLLELMIVVAIIGILAAIAYPSYRDVVSRNNRAVAKAALSKLASRQEAYFIRNKEYAQSLVDLGFPNAVMGLESDGGYSPNPASDGTIIYKLQLAGGYGQYGYKIQAIPANLQSGDPCGTLFVTATGKHGATGSRDDCW